MSRMIVSIWVREAIFRLRELEVEAPSFSHLQAMNQEEFATSITDYINIIDEDWAGEGDEYDMETLDLMDTITDSIPSDEAPDVEDIDPNAGRGK